MCALGHSSPHNSGMKNIKRLRESSTRSCPTSCWKRPGQARSASSAALWPCSSTAAGGAHLPRNQGIRLGRGSAATRQGTSRCPPHRCLLHGRCLLEQAGNPGLHRVRQLQRRPDPPGRIRAHGPLPQERLPRPQQQTAQQPGLPGHHSLHPGGSRDGNRGRWRRDARGSHQDRHCPHPALLPKQLAVYCFTPLANTSRLSVRPGLSRITSSSWSLR